MDKFRLAQNWLKKLSSESKFFREKRQPTLKTTRAILAALGNPDRAYDFRVIVGGTAGKATVCRYTEQVLLSQGKSVLTLVSPHIQVITERIRLSGKLISRVDFGKFILKIREISEKIKVSPSYFEAIVCAGILYGAQKGAEIFIGEIGMGGSWDAVNAVRGPRIAALTFVGEDHINILGPTLGDIARTKAGIFTSDSVLNLSYESKLRSELQSVAQSKIQFVSGTKRNLNRKISRKICEKILGISSFTMKKPCLPARFEKFIFEEKKIILDGAHSLPRFNYILPQIKKITGRKIGVFGMASGHETEAFQVILTEFDEVIWTKLDIDRKFADPFELQKKFSRGEVCLDCSKAFSLALKQCKAENTIFVIGSLYLCGKIREKFYDSDILIKNRQEQY